jgi:hypothetical protein
MTTALTGQARRLPMRCLAGVAAGIVPVTWPVLVLVIGNSSRLLSAGPGPPA